MLEKKGWGVLLSVLTLALAWGGDVEDRIAGGGEALQAPSGSPGIIHLFGEMSFPLAWCEGGGGRTAAVVAGSRLGEGRIVACSHGSFLGVSSLTNRANLIFFQRAIRWLGHGAPHPTLLVDARFGEALEGFKGLLPFTVVKDVQTLGKAGRGSVYALQADRLKEGDLRSIRLFMERGGGLLCASIGWIWRSRCRERVWAQTVLFNRLLGNAGLYVGPGVAPDARSYRLGEPMPCPSRLCDALDRVETDSPLSVEEGRRASRLFSDALEILPLSAPEIGRIRKLAGTLQNPPPRPGIPLTARDIKARLAMNLFLKEWGDNPLKNWPAHPAAAIYPGLPAEGSERVCRTLSVDLSVPRWHSTGLFAVAGVPVTLTFPEGAERMGLQVKVGSTHCELTRKDRWERAPVTDLLLPVKSRKLTFASPFGGLVYIVVPGKIQEKGVIGVRIGPASPAPWFKMGRDTPEAWREKIRQNPAPLGELESDKVILTVPRSVLLAIDDPGEVLKLWDRVMDLDAKLTGIPLRRSSPERISTDVQLCVGYMHAGYPIMISSESAEHLVCAETLRRGKVGDVWGFFHEMGHNHQNPDWTFAGTDEVTVNLFTLYCFEHICGIKPRQTRMGKEGIQRRVREWRERGSPYEEWKSDPFLALEFFVRLQQRYGWESLEKLFAEYRQLKTGEHPKTDLEKRRQWAVRLSRITGDDLVPLFRKWNILPDEDERITPSSLCPPEG